jgi:hypothetical protein
MPRSHLFEVDGVNPPRKISKLSLRYRRSIAALRKDNMPPRVARPLSGRAIVSQTHPAATAAAAAARVEAAADKINGGIFFTPTSRDSPSRAAKMLANKKKCVKFVIITHALPLRWRPPTMPKLRQVFWLILLMLSPASLFYLARSLSLRHSHPCGTRGGVEHVPPYILSVTVGS